MNLVEIVGGRHPGSNLCRLPGKGPSRLSLIMGLNPSVAGSPCFWIYIRLISYLVNSCGWPVVAGWVMRSCLKFGQGLARRALLKMIANHRPLADGRMGGRFPSSDPAPHILFGPGHRFLRQLPGVGIQAGNCFRHSRGHGIPVVRCLC